MGRSRQYKILLTGFGPFPGVPDNPSSRLIRRIERMPDHLAPDGTSIETVILPTEWTRVREIAATLLIDTQADMAVHFGTYSGSDGFRVEERAHNRAGSSVDARGQRHGGTYIVAGAPSALRTAVPARGLAGDLRRRRLPAILSIDAGDYLCNMLYYLSLRHARDLWPRKTVLLVHIPALARPGATAGPDALAMATLTDGTRAIIAGMVAFHGARVSERGASP